MFFCCDYLLSGIFKIFLSKFCNEIVHLEMKTTIYTGTQGKGGMGAARGRGMAGEKGSHGQSSSWWGGAARKEAV